MITTEVVKNPTAKDFELFRKFADKHEGKDTHFTPEEVGKYFFEKAKKIVFAKIGGLLVGAANIGIRSVAFDGENMSVGTIVGVVTHADYRRMGVATKVMERAVEEMKKDKIDFSILCTEIETLGGLYGKSGYIPLNKPYFFIDKTGVKRRKENGMVANIYSSEKFQKIFDSSAELNMGLSDF